MQDVRTYRASNAFILARPAVPKRGGLIIEPLERTGKIFWDWAMELLLLVFGLFIAWRVYVARLKKRAYEYYDDLAGALALHEAREEFARVFEILAGDLAHPGSVSSAEGLHFFDWAVFLQDRIEQLERVRPKRASGERSAEHDRSDVRTRLRAALVLEADLRRTGKRTSEPRQAEEPPKQAASGSERSQVELESSDRFFPKVANAIQGATKQFAEYRFVHFSDVTLGDGTVYPHALVVYDKTKKMRLVVTSELNALAPAGCGRSHFLCVWNSAGHENLGAADEWADAEKFSREAISLAIKSVVLADAARNGSKED